MGFGAEPQSEGGIGGSIAPIVTNTKTSKNSLKGCFYRYQPKQGLGQLPQFRRGHRGQHCPHSDSTYIKGGGWAAARSALCAVGCERRARSLGSVTVEDTSVTARHTNVTEEEFAADINGCCTYLRSGERSRCVQAFMGKRSLRIKSVQPLISAAKKRYRREKLILGWWVGCCEVGSLRRRL